MPDYADQLFVTVSGVPVEVAKVDWSPSFGKRTAVQTMNPTGRPLGTRQEVGECTFSIEVPVRAGMPPWETIFDATFVFVQRVGGTPLYTAIGAFYQDHKGGAQVNGEQMLTVSFGCLNWIMGA